MENPTSKKEECFICLKQLLKWKDFKCKIALDTLNEHRLKSIETVGQFTSPE